MNKKLIIIAGIALVVLLLAFYLWGPGSVPTGQQRSSSSHRLERRTTAPNLGLLRRPSVGDLKGKVEKLDCFVHVKCLPEKNADPAAFGKDVVGFSATGRNQLITDFLREGNVHQAVSMYARNSHSLLPPEMIHWMRMDGGTTVRKPSEGLTDAFEGILRCSRISCADGYCGSRVTESTDSYKKSHSSLARPLPPQAVQKWPRPSLKLGFLWPVVHVIYPHHLWRLRPK